MIKQVDEIPMDTKRKRESYRSKIRDDISEAIEKGISKFEFDGDYNYKYLAQYAKEEADNLLNVALREEWDKTPRHPYETNKWRIRPQAYERHIRQQKYIIIHNIKREDRMHVYCEIKPEVLGQMIEAHKKHLDDCMKREEDRSRERVTPKTDVHNLVKVKEGYEQES